MRILFALVVLGLTLAGPADAEPLASPMQAKRDTALASGDFKLALSYDDAILDYWVDKGGTPTPPPFDDQPRLEMRAQRRSDFHALAEDLLAKLGLIDEANVQRVWWTLLTLRAEAAREPPPRKEDLQAVDDKVIAPQLERAAALLWKEVDAAASRGELSAAIIRGTSIVAELRPSSPFVASLDVLRHQIQDRHLALAAKAQPEQFGARILHQRLATMFGATAPVAASDQSALVASTSLSWTLTLDQPCGLVAGLLPNEFGPGTGRPARLAVSFTRCGATHRDLSLEEQERKYTEEEMVTVPKESLSSVCSTSQGPLNYREGTSPFNMHS